MKSLERILGEVDVGKAMGMVFVDHITNELSRRVVLRPSRELLLLAGAIEPGECMAARVAKIAKEVLG